MTSRKAREDAATKHESVQTNAEQAGVTTSREASQSSALSQNEITILAETFRLLGDQSRLKIVLCCMHGSSSVGEIAERLELSPSLVSHHLRLLRGARLVKGVRHAKQVFYEIADQHVSQVLLDMTSHIAEDHADD